MLHTREPRPCDNASWQRNNKWSESSDTQKCSVSTEEDSMHCSLTYVSCKKVDKSLHSEEWNNGCRGWWDIKKERYKEAEHKGISGVQTVKDNNQQKVWQTSGETTDRWMVHQQPELVSRTDGYREGHKWMDGSTDYLFSYRTLETKKAINQQNWTR